MSPNASNPLSPRTGLAIAAAVTGLTLAGGATLATSLGWLRPPAAQASASAATPATVSAPLPATPGVAGGPTATDPSQATTLTQVDEVGNVWAWYGSGDWVLVTPAPPAPAPVLAPSRERKGEHDERAERAYQPSGDRSVLGAVQRAVSGSREHHDDH